MPCYSPLNAYRGKSSEADKTVITFSRPQSWRGERIDLPCGQCIGCRLERSRQWATRCVHEAQMHEENSFITLTYDDDHLPTGNDICDRCVRPHVKAGSVCVSHFQDFFKRLRKYYAPKKIRYYHCGEYGELLSRPHYHALLFGHDFSDKQLFSNRNGNQVYTSAELSQLWPFGFSLTGAVTFESAAYVARYVMKKITGEKADTHYAGRSPEYVTMSRRPGIGSTWYDKYKSDVYPHDRINVRGSFVRPPRFYDCLLEREDRSTLMQLKLNREKNSIRFSNDVLSDGRKIKVSESDPIRLRVKEEVKLAEVKKLIRPLEV